MLMGSSPKLARKSVMKRGFLSWQSPPCVSLFPLVILGTPKVATGHQPGHSLVPDPKPFSCSVFPSTLGVLPSRSFAGEGARGGEDVF